MVICENGKNSLHLLINKLSQKPTFFPFRSLLGDVVIFMPEYSQSDNGKTSIKNLVYYSGHNFVTTPVNKYNLCDR